MQTAKPRYLKKLLLTSVSLIVSLHFFSACTSTRVNCPAYANRNIDDAEKNRLEFLPYFSPYYIPTEQNFNYTVPKKISEIKIPFGGDAEYTRKNIPVIAGIGYNRVPQILSSTESFAVKTHTFSLYGKYIPIKFLQGRAEPFISAGITKWYAGFDNVLYPELNDYYPELFDNGFGYFAGAGMQYCLGNFTVGARFRHYAMPSAVFGEAAPDPSTYEEFEQWEPSEQYQLHPGSNQFQVFIGYRLNF